MEIKYSFVCDYAAPDSSGKLSVIGIFDNISAPEFPMLYPQFTYTALLVFHGMEIGTHSFRLSFHDSKDNEFLPDIHGEIDVRAPVLQSNIAVNFRDVSFPKPSAYYIDLYVDDRKIASERINVTTP